MEVLVWNVLVLSTLLYPLLLGALRPFVLWAQMRLSLPHLWNPLQHLGVDDKLWLMAPVGRSWVLPVPISVISCVASQALALSSKWVEREGLCEPFIWLRPTQVGLLVLKHLELGAGMEILDCSCRKGLFPLSTVPSDWCHCASPWPWRKTWYFLMTP